MVAEWYAEHVGTPYEASRMPQLYQKYIGHDNNRDGYGLSMIESRVAVRTNRHWEPQVIYSHHMTASMPATIWLPPYGEPIYPNIHPLMNRMVNLMGTAAAAALDERGMPGAEHKGEVYDAWYPGYIDFINFFHNIVIMFSETGIHGSPTPRGSTPCATFPRPTARCSRARCTRACGAVDGGACATRWTTCSRPPRPRSMWRRSTARTFSTTATRPRAT